MCKCLRHFPRQVPQDVAAVPCLPGGRPDVSLIYFAVLNPQMAPGNTCHLCMVTALKVLTLPQHSVHSVLPPALWGCADCHLHARHKLPPEVAQTSEPTTLQAAQCSQDRITTIVTIIKCLPAHDELGTCRLCLISRLCMNS